MGIFREPGEQQRDQLQARLNQALDLLERAMSGEQTLLCAWCDSSAPPPLNEPHQPDCPWLALMKEAGRR